MFFKDWETIKVWTLWKVFSVLTRQLGFSMPHHSHASFSFQIFLTVGTFLKKYIYFIFNWRVIALQYYDGFCHTSTWVGHQYISPLSWTSLLPPSPPQPSRLSQSTSLGFHASYGKLPWLSILHIVTNIFQCYSLKSSHLLLSPLSKILSIMSGCPLLSCT